MHGSSFTAAVLALTLLVSLSIVACSAQTGPKTITVPDDYPTLQTAVANTLPGDTVFVRSGTYTGGIVIDKPITLKGQDANTTTIVGGATAQNLGVNLTASTVVPEKTTLLYNPKTASSGIQPLNFIPPLTFAVIIKSNDVEISGFKIMGGDRAIYSTQGNNLKIHDNILGTCILGGSNNTVASNGRIGLTMGGFYNLIANNGGGIVLSSSNSTITGNSFGVFALQSAYSNVIVNNTLSGSNMGLWIGSSISSGPPTCSYNLFAGNKIENSGLWGILMGAGSYNVFYENVVENTGAGLDHDGYGLALGGNGQVAENNLFLHNSFVNNSKNFGVNWEVTGSNSFDDGREGNYWDDYFAKYPNATQVNHTGTGNIPYALIGNNVDNHPLLKQPIISGSMPVLPEPWASLLPIQLIPPFSSPSSTPTPTSSTTPSQSAPLTPTQTQMSSPAGTTPTATLSPSPSIPEFPVWIILAIAAVVAGLQAYLPKHRRAER